MFKLSYGPVVGSHLCLLLVFCDLLQERMNCFRAKLDTVAWWFILSHPQLSYFSKYAVHRFDDILLKIFHAMPLLQQQLSYSYFSKHAVLRFDDILLKIKTKLKKCFTKTKMSLHRLFKPIVEQASASDSCLGAWVISLHVSFDS